MMATRSSGCSSREHDHPVAEPRGVDASGLLDAFHVGDERGFRFEVRLASRQRLSRLPPTFAQTRSSKTS